MSAAVKIAEIVEKIKPENVTDIKQDSDLFAIGALDSFGVIEYVTELESAFDIKIPNDALIPQNLWSIEATAELVEKHKK